MNRRLIVGCSGVATALIIIFFILRLPYVPSITLPMKIITIGKMSLQVEIASTVADEKQGLSGRASLPEGRGMLFVFPQEGNYGFWMKGMLFPIDIIWIGSAGIVNTIASNVSPDTYPKVFYPTAPALYVLEVPAGWVYAHGIAPGTSMEIR